MQASVGQLQPGQAASQSGRYKQPYTDRHPQHCSCWLIKMTTLHHVQMLSEENGTLLLYWLRQPKCKWFWVRHKRDKIANCAYGLSVLCPGKQHIWTLEGNASYHSVRTWHLEVWLANVAKGERRKGLTICVPQSLIIESWWGMDTEMVGEHADSTEILYFCREPGHARSWLAFMQDCVTPSYCQCRLATG